MKKALTPTEMSKGQSDNTNKATKNSITQRLRTDKGRSVGVKLKTKYPLSIHMKSITKILKIGCCTLLRRRWPLMKMTRQICRFPLLGCHYRNECSFISVIFHINENYLKLTFIDTNIDMYVSFGKSVDNVTFRLSLHHLFVRGWKKKTGK